MRGIELEPGGLDYLNDEDSNDADSIHPRKPVETTLAFNKEDFILITEMSRFFFEKLDETIKEEGLKVHDRIADFLEQLKEKYGKETISNCAFYYILSMRHPMPADTERLDLEDGLIENFIKNGFKETEGD